MKRKKPRLGTDKWKARWHHLDALRRRPWVPRTTQSRPCPYCSVLFYGGGHYDHIVPRMRGGSDREYNLVNVCETCNLRKSGKTLAEFATQFCYDYAAIAERLRVAGKSLDDKPPKRE